jgi:ubiquinone/menaquinone biosynthesis C-methylase UbiE
MTSSSEQFAKNPEQYRDDKVFSAGKDLEEMKQSVGLPRVQTLLDIGTGAGHTAIAFASIAETCIGIDVTPEMVTVATQFAEEKELNNVTFQIGDVASLPFADESFCVVTCRLAAHHFPHINTAMQEISRVLKRGGVFLLVDHYAPADAELDHFVNTIDQTRDPSHVREYSLGEWKQLFQQNGLSYVEISKWDIPLHYDTWVARSATPEAAQQKLQHLFQSASSSAKDTFQITFKPDGSVDSFCLKSILVRGVKKQ